MTKYEPVSISSDICICGHWRDDHEPKCIVIEDGIECLCTIFTSDEDDGGYWFTPDFEEDGGCSST
jgi:hypothetical protein